MAAEADSLVVDARGVQSDAMGHGSRKPSLWVVALATTLALPPTFAVAQNRTSPNSGPSARGLSTSQQSTLLRGGHIRRDAVPQPQPGRGADIPPAGSAATAQFRNGLAPDADNNPPIGVYGYRIRR